ncbi:magnesium chelatase [Erythrobacter sp. QSSC1-22B]|uniref:magnesium chelatase subunit D n=1 Tax=Erythrobacter sp. QSSC1-22B TaxID=1860125 RepID=UPI000805238C|nr:magnesium chelatase subunit D [Erythrobacter sp. QSSC1-22B]OBX20582.1 magnesium chelatase [Erythrobacter sp. QSSC1-22B]
MNAAGSVQDTGARTLGNPLGNPLADALLALRLFAIAPRQLGGLCLRAAGPARGLLVERLQALLPSEAPLRRLPAHIDDERLLGGIDMAASLALGRSVRQTGLLEEVAGGVVLVPMAERLRPDLAGRLAQAMDASSGTSFGLLLFDDGVTAEEAPPVALAERVAFRIDLSPIRTLEIEESDHREALPIEAVEPGDSAALTALAGTAMALGVDSVRALLLALAAARAHAALEGRRELSEADLQLAARLVLAPRATRVPQNDQEEGTEPDDETPPPDQEPASDSDAGVDDAGDATPPEDSVLEAALAAIPPDLLARLAQGAMQRKGHGSGGGQRAKSKLRGRPLGARPGMPGGGARLALIDTLRAAVPWQPLRRRERGDSDSRALIIRKFDLHIRRFEERALAVTIFCVDASGSAAMARLGEAKGAVELMLAQAYVTRSEVALIAFRGAGAELLLPPTRSLTRARRALAQLPGGGGTPLAAGIVAARRLAASIASRGATPFLVFLTDGSANIAADGTPGRTRARDDATAAASGVAADGNAALVVDIAPRPRPEAEALARAMRARYLPLPLADAAGLQRAVEAARPSRQMS